MTALNITTNDLTDPILESRNRVTAYNDDIQRTMETVMSAEVDAVEEDTRKLVDLLKAALVSHEDIPDWAHDPANLEPANDNEPRQMDLFYDYDNTGETA